MRLRYNDKESLSVRLRHGAEGYCVLSCIFDKLEMSDDSTCRLDYRELALDFGTSLQLVQSIVEDFDIFTIDGDIFYYRKMKEERDRISAVYKERARKGGLAKAALSKKKDASIKENDASSTPATSTENSASSRNNCASSIKNAASSKNLVKENIPPITPIKENIALTGSSEINSNEFTQFIGARDKPKRKNRKIDVPISRGRDLFIAEYASRYDGEQPYLDGKEMKYIGELLKKIRFSRQGKELPVDDDSLIDAMSLFLKAINKEWISNNFSPTQIATHYNEIISEIVNKKKNGNNKSRYADRQGTPAPQVRGSTNFFEDI